MFFTLSFYLFLEWCHRVGEAMRLPACSPIDWLIDFYSTPLIKKYSKIYITEVWAIISVNIALQGLVERWLVEVEEMMVQSVQDVSIRAVENHPLTPHSQWITQWPSQVVLTVSQIIWTSQVTAALPQAGLKVCYFIHQYFLLWKIPDESKLETNGL